MDSKKQDIKEAERNLEEMNGKEFDRKMALKAETILNFFQLIVVYILLILFGFAVLDLGMKLFTFVIQGKIFQPNNVIALLETALLLFLVVEVFRTAAAHLEDKKVLPLVIDVAIIGVVRSIITFRLDAFETTGDALVAAGSYAVILSGLILSFFVIHRQERKEADPHPKEKS